MLEPENLGYRTDLSLRQKLGTVERRADHWVVRTPSSPGFHWGNFFLLDTAPPVFQLPEWRARFGLEFGSASAHFALAWDRALSDVELDVYRKAGLELENDVVLTRHSELGTSAPTDHVETPGLSFALATTERHWQAVANHFFDLSPARRNDTVHTNFITDRVRGFRELIADGRGFWLAAFLDGDLAGSLGLFRTGELARYQEVVVGERFRRRGIGQALVRASIIQAGTLGVSRLVIVARPGGHAERLYRRLGFEEVAHQQGFCVET
jgi:GNAT superfamily N-acetyltransferase